MTTPRNFFQNPRRGPLLPRGLGVGRVVLQVALAPFAIPTWLSQLGGPPKWLPRRKE